MLLPDDPAARRRTLKFKVTDSVPRILAELCRRVAPWRITARPPDTYTKQSLPFAGSALQKTSTDQLLTEPLKIHIKEQSIPICYLLHFFQFQRTTQTHIDIITEI